MMIYYISGFISNCPRTIREFRHEVVAREFSNPWPGTFLPTQVGELYDFPSPNGGKGINFGIFAFNGVDSPDPRGGCNAAALKSYFTTVIGGVTPSITNAVVQGPGNDPGPDTTESDNNGDFDGVRLRAG